MSAPAAAPNRRMPKKLLTAALGVFGDASKHKAGRG